MPEPSTLAGRVAAADADTGGDQSAGWIGIEIVLPADVGEDDVRLDALSGLLFEIGAEGLETRDQERPILLIASFPPDFGTLADEGGAIGTLADEGGAVGTLADEGGAVGTLADEGGAVGTLADEGGAVGYVADEGGAVGTLADEGGAVGTLADEPELEAQVAALAAAVGFEGVRVSRRTFEPIDWSTHWRQHFTSKRFEADPDSGKTAALWVVPTWLEPPEDAEHVLRIDPSSAFGTGLHETTGMCLEAVLARAPVSAALDVGTGTGILALAALLLGTERAVGTDIDPGALAVARENAERNGLHDRLTLSDADPGALGERFPLVLANILARPLIDLAPQIAAAVAPGGTAVLSGITAAQADDVVAAYEAEGLTKAQVILRGEWARVDLVAPGSRR